MADNEAKAITKYRDKDGIRLQTYRRFKEGIAYQPIDKEQMTAVIEFAQHCHKLHRLGRPPKYEDLNEFLGVIDAYWEVLSDKNQDGVKIIPDIEGFCCFAGISRETLNAWENTRSVDYSDTIKAFKNMIAAAKKQLALTGKIPALTFATDFNNNHGYTQKQDITIAPANPLGTPRDIKEIEAFAASMPED